jgi:UDP-N-acetylmuramoyl-tripeptide--D-alanyl-D-alanine ligase
VAARKRFLAVNIPTVGWLREALRAPVHQVCELELKNSIDSRSLCAGDTFWALSGARDGHEFVEAAFQAGAAAAVVRKDSLTRFPASVHPKLIPVNDPNEALAQAANAWRRKLKGAVIGITGSVGKTTTKDFIASALGDHGLTHATKGNFNNEIGLPLTLLAAPADARYIICEMGATREGDIRRLCDIARPDFGIVTAIAAAHLEKFGSMEGVQRAKGELYDFVADHGFAFVPYEDERCVSASARCKNRIGYGFSNPGANWKGKYVYGDALRFDSEGLAAFTVDGEVCRLSIPGRPAALAGLAAMTVARHFGMPASVAALSVTRTIPTGGRAKLMRMGSLSVIDDSYNANPASMRAALETLSMRDAARKVAILGDMLELGEITGVAHEEVLEELDRSGVSLAILIGPSFQHAAASCLSCARVLAYESSDQILNILGNLLKPNDLVLVKASRGMALDRVVTRISELFS